MKIFESKNAVVTGGGQGIGKAICEKLADNGANIIIFDINEEIGNQTVKDISEKYNVKSKFYKVNISLNDEVVQKFDEVLNEFGQVHFLINNAGITKDNLFFRMSVEDWKMVIDVNLTGAFNCTKAIIRKMAKQKFNC